MKLMNKAHLTFTLFKQPGLFEGSNLVGLNIVLVFLCFIIIFRFSVIFMLVDENWNN